jgi:hypothetical protein
MEIGYFLGNHRRRFRRPQVLLDCLYASGTLLALNTPRKLLYFTRGRRDVKKKNTALVDFVVVFVFSVSPFKLTLYPEGEIYDTGALHSLATSGRRYLGQYALVSVSTFPFWEHQTMLYATSFLSLHPRDPPGI